MLPMHRAHRYTLTALAALALAGLACASITRLAEQATGIAPPAPGTPLPPESTSAPESQAPIKLEGGPTIGTADETQAAITEQARTVNELVAEDYTQEELKAVNKTFTYTATLDQDERLLWFSGWCATSAEILQDNLTKMQFQFAVNGAVIPADYILTGVSEDSQNDPPLTCQNFVLLIYDWPEGTTTLENQVIFLEQLNDGMDDYPEGTQTFEYKVTR